MPSLRKYPWNYFVLVHATSMLVSWDGFEQYDIKSKSKSNAYRRATLCELQVCCDGFKEMICDLVSILDRSNMKGC
jgi:hypothetical protein